MSCFVSSAGLSVATFYSVSISKPVQCYALSTQRISGRGGGFVSNPFNSRGNFTQVAPTLLMDLNKNCSHLKMLLTDIGIDRFDLKKYHFQHMLENE